MRKTMMKIAIATALVGIALFGVASRARSGGTVPSREAAPQQAQGASVTIDNFSFTPQEITVSPGTTVRWVNQDDVPHTVVSNDKKFKSKALDTDDKFSFTFTDPGTYEYYCSVHPKMTAKVTVK
jgi:plastocyanin